jgi:hypothetical protein
MGFDVLQTEQSAYGRHYFLGDVVTGAFNNVSANVKIDGVTISVSAEAERISLELEQIRDV